MTVSSLLGVVIWVAGLIVPGAGLLLVPYYQRALNTVRDSLAAGGAEVCAA